MSEKLISDATQGEPVVQLVWEYSASVTPVSGSVSHTTTRSFSRRILMIIVTPTTAATSYHYSVTETTSGRVIKRDQVAHTGESLVIVNYPVYNDTVNVNITSASVDEVFTVKLRYQ